MLCCYNGALQAHSVLAGLSSGSGLASSCRFPTAQGKKRRVRQLAACSTTMAASSVQNSEAWKHQEPYLPAKDDEGFKIQHKASCMCGQIQYVVDSDPVAAKYCHCTSCQTLHGMFAA